MSWASVLNVLERVFIPLGALGAIGFFFGFLCAMNLVPFLGSVELPLGEVEHVVVDHDGRIYLKLSFYSRVQQYDHDGRFLRGWHVPTHSWLGVSQDNKLLVITRQERRCYDREGILVELQQEEPSNFYPKQMTANTAAGEIFEIHRRLLFPYVARVDRAGKSVRIIDEPWYKSLLGGPLTSWAVAVTGFCSSGLISKLRKRYAPTKRARIDSK